MQIICRIIYLSKALIDASLNGPLASSMIEVSQPGQLQWPWLKRLMEGALLKLLLCPPPLPLLFKLYEEGSFVEEVGELSGKCIEWL